MARCGGQRVRRHPVHHASCSPILCGRTAASHSRVLKRVVVGAISGVGPVAQVCASPVREQHSGAQHGGQPAGAFVVGLELRRPGAQGASRYGWGLGGWGAAGRGGPRGQIMAGGGVYAPENTLPTGHTAACSGKSGWRRGRTAGAGVRRRRGAEGPVPEDRRAAPNRAPGVTRARCPARQPVGAAPPTPDHNDVVPPVGSCYAAVGSAQQTHTNSQTANCPLLPAHDDVVPPAVSVPPQVVAADPCVNLDQHVDRAMHSDGACRLGGCNGHERSCVVLLWIFKTAEEVPCREGCNAGGTPAGRQPCTRAGARAAGSAHRDRRGSKGSR